MDPPGFMFSIFTKSLHRPVSKCFSSSIGVLPIISKMPPKTGASERSAIVEVGFIFQVYRSAQGDCAGKYCLFPRRIKRAWICGKPFRSASMGKEEILLLIARGQTIREFLVTIAP
jgi:hypothetical protein